jgi:hypothetical protein
MGHDDFNCSCGGSPGADLESEFCLFVHGADQDADAVPPTQLIQHDEAGADGRGV